MEKKCQLLHQINTVGAVLQFADEADAEFDAENLPTKLDATDPSYHVYYRSKEESQDQAFQAFKASDRRLAIAAERNRTVDTRIFSVASHSKPQLGRHSLFCGFLGISS